MPLCSSDASPLKGVLLAAAVLLSPSLGLAQTGPFAGLEGAWSGNGVISSNDGRSERLRCRAQYHVSPSGKDLDLQLHCTSDSYQFDVNSQLVLESNGAIEGQWTETNHKAGGGVEARANGDQIVAKIAGPGFTADMKVGTHGKRQRVEIISPGWEIRSVSVDMHRG